MVDQYVRRCRVTRVIDGDTLECDIDLGWGIRMRERIRLIGVDAPEVRGPDREDGMRVKAEVVEWCNLPRQLWIRSIEYERGKYGRTLAVVFSADGEPSLNELVIRWSRASSSTKGQTG